MTFHNSIIHRLLGILLVISSPHLTIGQFLAGSEARNFEREAKAPSGAVFDAAMTSDMHAACGNIFQIESFPTDKITNTALRKHLRKFLSNNRNKPVSFKLTQDLATTTSGQSPQGATSVGSAVGVGGNTYRARVQTSDGIRLRGFWKRGPDPESLTSRDLLTVSYDDAIRRRGSLGSHVEFQIQLPPLAKTASKTFFKDKRMSTSLFLMPSVVYSLVLGKGASNRDASVVKSVALVKIYPKGIGAKGFSLGKTTICQPMKAGIVDPSWCKGRTIFRQGRSVGLL